jgi:hypothetical protein
MLGALIVVLGLVPMIFGVYAWTLIRNNDERGPDDPPPPPPPETPLPIVPPTLCRRDRDAAPPPRSRIGWRAPVRTRR